MRYALLLTAIVALLPAQTPYRILREGGRLLREETGAFELGPSQVLRILAPGAVNVRGEARSDVAFRIRRRITARELKSMRFTARASTILREPGLVTLAVPSFSPTEEIFIEVTVPEALHRAELRVDDGQVTAVGLNGNLDIDAGAGSLFIDRIGNGVTARTGGGQVHLGSVNGPVDCRTGGGGITLDRAGASSRLSSDGGEILIREAHGPVFAETQGGNVQVWRALSTVRVQSVGGLIEVNQAQGGVSALVGEGGIHVGVAQGVQCRATAGTIRLDAVRGGLEAVTGRGSIVAGVGGGAIRDSRLITGEGDITVFLPSNLRVTVQAETQAAGSVGGIVTEFPQIAAPGLQWLFGPHLRMAGSLNGGGPRLTLSTVGGAIYLKKQKTE